MRKPGFVYLVLEGEESSIKSIYLDENFAEAEVLSKGSDWIWTEERAISDWDAESSGRDTASPQSAPSDEPEFRPASIQAIVSEASVTAAIAKAHLAWLAYNSPETIVSGDEYVDGKLSKSGETAAAAWSRLTRSAPDSEFLKLQSLVPQVPQR